MLMPKASMYKYGQPVFGKNQIGLAWKVLSVQAEAQPHSISDSPHDEFGSRVTTSYASHQFASSLAVDDVGHTLSPDSPCREAAQYGCALASGCCRCGEAVRSRRVRVMRLGKIRGTDAARLLTVAQ